MAPGTIPAGVDGVGVDGLTGQTGLTGAAGQAGVEPPELGVADEDALERRDVVAKLSRVADVQGKALQAFDRLADVVAADRRRHDALRVGVPNGAINVKFAGGVHGE